MKENASPIITIPDNMDGFISETSMLVKQGKFKEVLNLLSDDLLKKVDNGDLWSIKSKAYSGLKLYNEAIEMSIEALRLNPNDARRYEDLGVLYQKIDDQDNAEKYFKLAVANKGYTSITWAFLGDVYFKKGDFKSALNSYRNYLNEFPDSSFAHYNIGTTLFELEDYNAAKESLMTYIQRTSDKKDFLVLQSISKIDEIDKRLRGQNYNQISLLLSDIKHLLLFKDDCITHYTSLEVAKKLILEEDNALRLSEGTFLNDPSEGTELFKLFPSFFAQNNNLQSEGKEDMDTIAKPFVQKPFIGSYVSKFKENDLTLWRMYGKDNKEEAKGCAITMDREKMLFAIAKRLVDSNVEYAELETDGGESKEQIKSLYPEILNEDFNFYRVAYKTHNKLEFSVPGLTDDKVKSLNELIGNLINEVRNFMASEDNVYRILDIKELLNSIAYLFKTAEYIFENEVRLVVKGTGFDKKVDLRFIPPKVYVELADISPFISQLTLGPKVSMVEEWSAAFHYHLENKGYNPNVHISRLPFK